MAYSIKTELKKLNVTYSTWTKAIHHLHPGFNQLITYSTIFIKTSLDHLKLTQLNNEMTGLQSING